MYFDWETLLSVVLMVLVMCTFITTGGPHRPTDFPPGPKSWPFIGALHRLFRDPFEGSLKMMKQYGPAVGLDYGPYRAIILNDYKLIKDALTNASITGRPSKMPQWKTTFRAKDPYLSAGILHAEDRYFRQHHTANQKFVLETLEELGPKRIEKVIMDQLDKILEFMDTRARHGRQLESIKTFERHMNAILWKVFSHRKIPEETGGWDAYKITDGLFGMKKFRQSQGIGSSLQTPLMLSSWWKLLLPRFSGWFEFDRNYDTLAKIIGTCLDDHKRDPCRVASDRDFIDIYMDKMAACIDAESINYRKLGDFNLVSMIGDLLIGGLNTTSVTLTWAIAIVANLGLESEVLQKLVKELDGVVGKDNLVTLEHRPKLIYMQAFIKEVLRFRPALPWSYPHWSMDYTKIAKFNVPQWTIIFANNYGLFKDPALFPEPEVFKPERFLSEDEKEVITMEEFIPFSMANRLCPGMKLAEDILFVLLSNILKRYEVNVDSELKDAVLEHQLHFILTPKPFDFMLYRRHKPQIEDD